MQDPNINIMLTHTWKDQLLDITIDCSHYILKKFPFEIISWQNY